MNIILKSAKIYDKDSPYHLSIMDIFIESGVITEISDKIEKHADRIINSPALSCSPGWVDIGALCGEPGNEQRENFDTLARAARLGGYTAVALFPNTNPPTQNRASIKYIKDRSQETGFRFLPIAALSKDVAGKEMNELLDLSDAGAVAFSDGLSSVTHPGLMLRIVQYLSQTDKTFIHFPTDFTLAPDGQMHEGVVSTLLGLKGIPSIAETVVVARDIRLREYANGRMCFYGISAKESVKQFIEARSSCDKIELVIPFMNMIYDDSALLEFDVNFKVMPPIRSSEDREALVEALKAGYIDAISSNHVPLDTEDKKLEFPYAKPGASGIEVCYSVLQHHLCGQVDEEILIHCLSKGPRKILGIESANIVEGVKADITIFDPSIEFFYTQSLSLGINNPHLGKKFKGKVLGTIVNNSIFENQF